MVRFSRRKGGAAAADYPKLDDAGRPAVAHWVGQLAEELKLVGKVAWETFAKLCDNKHPETGERLTARNSKDRVAVWDVVILAPKSVAIVGELTGDERLLEAHRQTVSEVAAAIERDIRTQISRFGQTGDRVTGNMAAIDVFHPIGRPVREDGMPDMGWHNHLEIVNATRDPVEGKIKAIHTRQLLQESDYYATLYRSGMAARVTELGYGIREKGKYWEMAGVSDATIKKFSRREQEAEAYKEEHQLKGKAALQAGARSRSRKKHDLEMTELRKYWDGRLTDQERQGLAAVKEKAMEPALAEGHVRLYRAESSVRIEHPDWIRAAQIESGQAEAQGRWFTQDRSHLDWYREDIGPSARTMFVDVPAVEVEKLRVSNIAETIKGRTPESFSRNPENEFFVSRELAAKRQSLEGANLRKTQVEEVKATDVRKAFQHERDVMTAKRKPMDQVPVKRLAAAVMRDFYGKAKPEQVAFAIRASGLRIKAGMVSHPNPRVSMADRIRRSIHEKIAAGRKQVMEHVQKRTPGMRW